MEPEIGANNAPAETSFVMQSGNGTSFQGDVARILYENEFNVNALRTQDYLGKDAWTHFDTAVLDIARATLVGVGDLMSRGLVYHVPGAMGVTRIEWERTGDVGPADLNMAGVTEGRNDTMEGDLVSMPLPIVHKDFWINIRKLAASRNHGTPLDTTMVQLCTRKVSERIESMLFLGDTSLGANNAILGYATAPNRVTGSTTASWATATGAQILADVIAMIAAANAKEMWGPFVFYVNYASMSNLGNDFKAESDKTILQRIKEIPGVADIRQSSYVPNGDTVFAIQMSSDVVDIIDGIQPTVVQWPSLGGMRQNFKVLAIMVPRVKSTYAQQSGIIHYT